MNAPIKLSDQRVREILAFASEGGHIVTPQELQALAQNVVDLRAALHLLTAHADTLGQHQAQLIEECERKRRELDELRGVVR